MQSVHLAINKIKTVSTIYFITSDLNKEQLATYRLHHNIIAGLILSWLLCIAVSPTLPCTVLQLPLIPKHPKAFKYVSLYEHEGAEHKLRLASTSFVKELCNL